MSHFHLSDVPSSYGLVTSFPVSLIYSILLALLLILLVASASCMRLRRNHFPFERPSQNCGVCLDMYCRMNSP